MAENLELPQKDLNTENFIHPIRGNMVYSHLALFASLGDCSSRNPMTGMEGAMKQHKECLYETGLRSSILQFEKTKTLKTIVRL